MSNENSIIKQLSDMSPEQIAALKDVLDALGGSAEKKGGQTRAKTKGKNKDVHRPKRMTDKGGTVSQVRLTGENRFTKMKEFRAAKSDTKIDKLLWKDRDVSPRRDPVELFDIECDVCGEIFSVGQSELSRDEDTKEITYTCNDCLLGRVG